MGFDVCDESGVVVESSRMLRAIKEEHLNQLKVAVGEFLAVYSRATQGNANDEDQSILGGTPDPQDAAEALDYFRKLKDIEKTTDLSTIHKILDSVIEAEADIETEDDDGDSTSTYVRYGEELGALWNLINDHCFPKVPYISEVRYFNPERVAGGDVPMGEVCFIFVSDDCFTVKMSVAGKALKDVVGSIEETSWSIMCY